MKRIVVIGATFLFLLFGTTAIAYAQQDQQRHDRDNAKPAPQQKQQAAKPAQRQAPQPAQRPVARPQQSYGGSYHGGVRADGPVYGGVHHSGVPQHQGQVRGGFVQSRAGSWKDEHQSWRQRGGYNGYRVPEKRFNTYFGREHFFRIAGLPMVFVGGQPRFQYDGYWVTFMDPWPEDWDQNWYESDDVYLDYTDDGYYLYNRRHPGFPIAVTITF
jgi:hypothetical protein